MIKGERVAHIARTDTVLYSKSHWGRVTKSRLQGHLKIKKKILNLHMTGAAQQTSIAASS